MKMAKGEFIAFLDADDVWCDKYKLQKQVDFLKKYPDYGMIGTNEIAIDSNGKERKSCKKKDGIEIKKTILLHCEFTQSSILIRKEIVKKVGFFDEAGIFVAVEDYEYWLRVGRVCEFANLPDYCVKYRLGIGISSKNAFRRRVGVLKMVINNFKFYPNATFAIFKHCLIFFVPANLVVYKQKIFNYKT